MTSTWWLTTNSVGPDFADTTTAILNGTIASPFKFTGKNEKVVALNGTLQAADTLLDNTTTDNDVLEIRASGGATVMGTVQNIETIEFIGASAATTALNMATVTGAKTFKASGTFGAGQAGITLTNAGATGITTYDFSGVTSTAAVGAVNLALGTTTPSANLTITGGAGNDVLTAGSGDDVMVGGAGNDTLNAGGGNNTVDVGAGAGAQFVTFSNGNNDVKATGATGAVTVADSLIESAP